MIMVRRSLLPIFLLFLGFFAFGQQTQRTAYAITGGQKGQFNWTEVKFIDLNTGEVLQSVYENGRTLQVLNARTGQPISTTTQKATTTENNNLPFSTYSAACAYDKKHNRLYYTPMGINQLRYIDLNGRDPRFFYFEGEAFGKVTSLQDDANHVTRMVIGYDGNGYALTNDANHLLKFTTGKKPVITDLGNLVDGEKNGAVSVHNKCSSWGGDLIADAFGNLFLISARQAVFSIELSSRIASFKGFITGLPANYSTNGAVVDGEGNVIVGSANSINAYYTVDLNSLKATAIPPSGQVFNTSDLANGNFAFQKEADQKASAVSAAQVNRRDLVRNSNITVYPNPVTEGSVRLYFNNQQAGRYKLQLVDLAGRVLNEQVITIASKIQVEEMILDPKFSRGVYMVKLLDGKRKATFTEKILVQ
jgi:Secretion system C-terminal sorting domain